MEVQSLRKIWTPWCDHWSARPPMATWYSECRRLRVSYLVEEGVFRLYVARGARWVLEYSVYASCASPQAEKSWAYSLLAAEVRARFPERPTAVTNPVGCRATRPPKTVRR